MGTVFRADDLIAGEPVAIKILDHAIDRERARREIIALRRLRHPSIVRYIADGETADGRLFFAMEWLDGTTLGELISGDGFTVGESVIVVRQVAIALGVAHAEGIVHRDIKPSNIVLVGGRIDAAKLIDFGVARIIAASSLTRTGTTMGTPGYMAPEQARGDRDLTSAVDVFGLGCVLYECIAGRPAFSGTLVAALMTKILLASPVPLAQVCPEAPPALCEVVERMLAKDPTRRLASAAHVVAELDKLGALPSSARRSSQLAETATLPFRNGTCYCLAISSRGYPDDVLEPPPTLRCDQLAAAAGRWQGRFEVLAIGAVVAHFSGARATVVANAAGYATDARRILPDFVTVVSDVDEDVGIAADRCTMQLSEEMIAAILSRR
jgi:serine/threonine protein kinase